MKNFTVERYLVKEVGGTGFIRIGDWGNRFLAVKASRFHNRDDAEFIAERVKAATGGNFKVVPVEITYDFELKGRYVVENTALRYRGQKYARNILPHGEYTMSSLEDCDKFKTMAAACIAANILNRTWPRERFVAVPLFEED